MADRNTKLCDLKCRAQYLADAAHLAYWLPASKFHKEALETEIAKMKAILTELEGRE